MVLDLETLTARDGNHAMQFAPNRRIVTLKRKGGSKNKPLQARSVLSCQEKFTGNNRETS